jgi:cytochrome P450
VGAALAGLEVEVAVTTLAERVPGLRLAGAPDELTWRPSWRSFGPSTLPVHTGR